MGDPSTTSDSTDVEETTALLPAGPYRHNLRKASDASTRSSSSLPSTSRAPDESNPPDCGESASTLTILTVIPILILGAFIANGDGSLVVASNQKIASEFNSLSEASWLVSSYILAQCATQPLYGKLSDIFGRKANLACAYILFTAGCLLCGIGQSYWVLLCGRAISGVGGAGMTALVAIIITDLVPLRDIATWRSYVNLAATLGRAIGGPVGGVLTDTVGWRWLFIGQVPLTMIGLILILWKLPSSSSSSNELDETVEPLSLSQKFHRVDVTGSIMLAGTISAFLLLLEFTTQERPWWHLLIVGLMTICFGTGFYLVERKWAKEPILPIELLAKRATLTSYALVGAQIAAQFSLFYSIPLYFQVVSGTTVADAGARLVPAVAGNAVGGLASGYMISRTGRYKTQTIVAGILAAIGYTLVFLRWRGDVSWAEVMYIIPGGFGTGIIISTSFVHLAASLDQSEMAIAGATLYLVHGISTLIGIQGSTSISRIRLRIGLDKRLDGVPEKNQIVEQALSNIHSIWHMVPEIREQVIGAYVDGLGWTFASSFIFTVVGIMIALTMREQRI